MKQTIVNGLVGGAAGIHNMSPDRNTDFMPDFAAHMQQQSLMNNRNFVSRFIAALNV